jgi:hypothetical protein
VTGARLVWDTWRRLLTSDDLVEWTLRGEAGETLAALSAAERAIVDDYAATREATETNIGMFRRGLTRNAKGALSLVPLSRRLALATGIDLDSAAEDFARDGGYRDYGPNMWGLAEDFVAHLSRLPELDSPAHRDVLAIDQATAALARRLGARPVAAWPDEVARRFAARRREGPDGARLSAHPAAAWVATAHDLTPWLEDPDRFDAAAPLQRSPHYWLIYFPAPDSDVEFAELSERSARALGALGAPATLSELADALAGPSRDELRDALDALCELGVVVREAG